MYNNTIMMTAIAKWRYIYDYDDDGDDDDDDDYKTMMIY